VAYVGLAWLPMLFAIMFIVLRIPRSM
jgi:hypothetical protein